MKALIVDDEPLARERLETLLRDCGEVEVVGHAGDGRAAVEAAARLNPELVLLDIRMPVMDGLEAARHIALLDNAPAIILCTAYDKHALAAFDVGAIDYLVKPVRPDRLCAALERARRYSRVDIQHIESSAATRPQRTHLCARVRGNLVLIPVHDILFLQAEDKYVVVHHTGGEVLIEETLKSLEPEFEDRFVRIHRNCLVARQRLSGLTRAADGTVFVKLDESDAALEVSRRNLPALRRLVRSL